MISSGTITGMPIASDIMVSSKNNTVVKSMFFKSDNEAKTLVVIFPGYGYSCDMPLLYYCTEAALQANCDVINLKYYFQCSETKYENNDDDNKQIIDDCYNAISKNILNTNRYENIVFVSKSIGTRFAGGTAVLFNKMEINHFYLTPLPKTIPYIENSVCTVIVGDRDSLFTDENIMEIKSSALPTIHIMKEANHSLENSEDCIQSIIILTNVTKIWINYLSALQ